MDYHEYVGFDGLKRLTISDLRKPDKLIYLLTIKVNELSTSRFAEQQLETRIRFLIDLLRESLADRYQDLSLIALARILVALDYFLKVRDAISDTHPEGYLDDFKEVDQVFREFKFEFDAFRMWKARQHYLHQT